jgi:hypothetical protein
MSQLPSLMKLSPVDKFASILFRRMKVLTADNVMADAGIPAIEPIMFDHIKALTQALMITHNSSFMTSMKEVKTEEVALNVFLVSLYVYLRNFGIFYDAGMVNPDVMFKPLQMELKINLNFISTVYFALDPNTSVLELLSIISTEINSVAEDNYEAGTILTERNAIKVVFGEGLVNQ